MASAYTAIIEEKDDVSLNEFVWRVAHGWCYDLGLKEKIDFRTRKNSYYNERLEETEKEIKELSGFTEDQKREWSRQRIEKSKRENGEILEKKKILLAKYQKMLQKVNDWQIPTQDHSRLKSYMIEQITQSIQHDCDLKYYEEICNSTRDELEHFNEYYRLLLNQEKYYKEQIEKEQKCYADRYNFFLAIENSVGPEPDYK